PAIYQLIVQDNGTCINYEENKGIGLKNISDRVASFNGNMNLSFDKGFKVFISIPKR
ncbi:MAG TPA: two-component sensor histidine kinase, partial [Clostridiaceae bacterium]|nr:two-component sensor histidine kinase [Clostridiaceae bacterium]